MPETAPETPATSAVPRRKRGRLKVVLEPYAPEVPGFFLYFPRRAQVSPAFRAFVEVTREVVASTKKR